jgi:hypothetical protein
MGSPGTGHAVLESRHVVVLGTVSERSKEKAAVPEERGSFQQIGGRFRSEIESVGVVAATIWPSNYLWQVSILTLQSQLMQLWVSMSAPLQWELNAEEYNSHWLLHPLGIMLARS